MVERVAFATNGSFRGKMDEFYLPEDIVEWLGLKKSEYLSKLIEKILPDDVQFEQYMQFEELIPSTLSNPDWSVEKVEDGHKVKTFVRTYNDNGVFQQVVIGALVPDQEKNDVFIPIISFVTKKPELISHFAKQPTQQLH